MAYTEQPKNLLILNILDILKRYSDADHRLSQKDIIDILKNDYQMSVDRKAVKRNLMNLVEYGYKIEYKESVRINKKGEAESIYSDWYLEREFSDAEVRLIIESILLSKDLSQSQCRDLIEKVKWLSNSYFNEKVSHICNLPEDKPDCGDRLLNMELLSEAIETGKQVEFSCGDHGTDMKFHVSTNDDGSERRHVFNPYQIAATNGKYYLIGNDEEFESVSYYRVDKICGVTLLDTDSKPKHEVRGLEYGLELPKHKADQVYMFSGDSERVTMQTTPEMAGELIEWFGNSVTFSNETEASVTASVRANLNVMKYWALEHSAAVTVLSPESLVDRIKEDLKAAGERYGI